jgi:hypothetical protein
MAYGKYSDGIEDIQYVKEVHKRESRVIEVPTKVVGSFGIETDRERIVLHWVVSHRKDKRHGVIDKPEPMGRYAKTMLRDMFRGWK